MRDFNKTVTIERFPLGAVDKDDLGRKIYEKAMFGLQGIMYTGENATDINILDIYCSQSYLNDCIQGKNIKYVGLDPQQSYERDGKKMTPNIAGDINSIPVKDNTFDMIFAVAQRFGYGSTHQGVFEVERIIKPQGYLVVALTKYWFQKGFNQLLFCYRNWDYVKAIEISYKLNDAEGTKETSKYFSVYRYQRHQR